MTLKGPAAKGPPGGIERRATPRSSYSADRQRAIIISVLVHLCVIALLVLIFPHLPIDDPGDLEKPIAISLVDASPEPEAEAPPDTAAQPQGMPSQQVEAQPAQAQEAAPSDSLPYDPSFNPFSPQAPEVTETTSAAPAPMPEEAPSNTAAPPIAAPPGDNAAQGGSPGGTGTTNGLNGISPGLATPPPGSPVGDPLLHPQYLRVQLHDYISLAYGDQLHQFLLNLIRCGVVPVPGQNPNMSVEADVFFSRIGIVQNVHLTNLGMFPGDPAYQKAAAELMGALTRPGCGTMHLPPQIYPAWGQVHLSFFQTIPGQ